MLGNSAVVVVVVVIVRTRPRAIPLAKISMRKSNHGFPLSFPCMMSMGLRLAALRVPFIFPLHDECGAPLGGPSGRRSSAKTRPTCSKKSSCEFANLTLYFSLSGNGRFLVYHQLIFKKLKKKRFILHTGFLIFHLD